MKCELITANSELTNRRARETDHEKNSLRITNLTYMLAVTVPSPGPPGPGTGHYQNVKMEYLI